MSRQLFVYEKDMPTVALIRAAEMERAKTMGTQPRFVRLADVTGEDLNWCDVLVQIRPHAPYCTYVAKKAQQAGRFVSAYYDDDIYDLPQGLPNPFWRRNSVLRTLKNSHIIISSSRYICEKYRKYTMQKRSFAGETVVAAEEIKRIVPIESAANGEKVKIIYAAGIGHTVFFNRFILPVMPQLCERYAGKISMTFMGVHPELEQFASQIELNYYPTMGLEEYRKKISEGNYDIGLSPLISDEFTKCKYFNKFIEYTMAGIVGVYSETEPYTYVVKNNENGFLVKDEPQDWYECLCRVIDDALLRNRCVCAAQELLENEFTQERLVERERREIPENLNHCAEGKIVGSLALRSAIYKILSKLERLYLVFFYFKREGLASVLNKMKNYHKEKAFS